MKDYTKMILSNHLVELNTLNPNNLMLIADIPEGVLINQKESVMFINPILKRLLNLTNINNFPFPLELITNIVADEDKKKFKEYFIKPKILGNGLKIKIELSKSEFKYIIIKSSYVNIDNLKYMFSLISDITEKENHIINLMEENNTLKSAINSSIEPFIIINNKGANYTIECINDSAIQILDNLYGYQFKVGDTFFDHLPFEKQQIWNFKKDQILNGEIEYDNIEENYKLHGTDHSIQFKIMPIKEKSIDKDKENHNENYKEYNRDSISKLNSMVENIEENKKKKGLVIIGGDISQHIDLIANFKNINKERSTQITKIIKKLKTEIEERKKIEKSLRIAKSEAEAANRAKSQFLANMSHELRTPLNSVLGFSEILIDELQNKIDDQLVEFLRLINNSGNHLVNIINDILDLSKIESGVVDLNCSYFNLGRLIKETVNYFQEQAHEKKITLTLQIKDKILSLFADQTRIRQVLINLISNAIKFTPESGKVGITQEIINGDAKITIWDTGIGIDELKMDYLFKPFQQIENPFSKKYQGTGLGLYFSKKLVELHEGKIWAESKLGKGTKFYFTLPLPNDEDIQKPKINILFLGLDYSGKTSIIRSLLNKSQPSKYFATGFIEKCIDRKENYELIYIDLPGKDKFRTLWDQNYEIADIIVFVIDISDQQRYDEVNLELQRIFADPILQGKKFIILFHKFDRFPAGFQLSSLHQKLLGNIISEDDSNDVIIIHSSLSVPESRDKIKKVIKKILESDSI